MNGAGKTTALRILACDLLPSSGRVLVDGIDVVERPGEVRERIGYAPDTPPLYNEMRVDEYLAFAAKLRGVPSGDVDQRVADVAKSTNLGDVIGDPIGSLSHGYRQRVGIAQAIVHSPKLVVLDEPISGLDPVQIVEMRRTVRALGGTHTVLVSSHILSEISETCDRILVIKDGEIVASGTEKELSSELLEGTSLQVTVRGSADAARSALEGLEGVSAVSDAAADEPGDELSCFHVSTNGDIRESLIKRLVAADVGLIEVTRQERELESVFLRLAAPKGEAPGLGGEGMSKALLVAGRELSAYFRSPLAAVILAGALLINGILFYWYGLTKKALSADVLSEFFWASSGVTMAASLFLSMRARRGRERQTQTFTLLNTAPLRDVEIVLGKFVSAYSILLLYIAMTVYMPALIFVNGKVSLGHIAVGYCGLALLGAATISIGLFASCLTRSQVVSIIIGGAILAALILLWMIARAVDPPLNTVLAAFAFHHNNFRPFMQGMLELQGIAYYLMLTYFFLLGATKILEARRWR